MPRDIDRYPFLSPAKRRATDPAAVADLVRASWPGATQEGSTGFKRSWTVRSPEGPRLVAHSWSPIGDMRFFWVRLAATLADTVLINSEFIDPRLLAARRPG